MVVTVASNAAAAPQPSINRDDTQIHNRTMLKKISFNLITYYDYVSHKDIIG